jgi:hypothetical protein
MQTVQELEPADGRHRKEFVVEMLNIIESDNDFLVRVIFCDESNLAERHNCRVGVQNPHM